MPKIKMYLQQETTARSTSFHLASSRTLGKHGVFTVHMSWNNA